MRSPVAACAAIAAAAMLASACSQHESPYDRYKHYLATSQYGHVPLLTEDNTSQLSGLVCSPDTSTVGQGLDIATADGQDQGVGTVEAAFVAKAYCDDWTKAYLNLITVVRERFGARAVYTVPQ